MLNRRRTDPSVGKERRRSAVDRRAAHRQSVATRFPSRREQALQFLTRYLFAVLGLFFFNFSSELQPQWFSVAQMNVLFGVYLAINTGNFVHAWSNPLSPVRFRVALWIDLMLVTVCVVNDPYEIPPSMAAYIVVVLGNGMRYGMRLFAEALWGTLTSGAAVIAWRYTRSEMVFSPGALFLFLFGAIIIVYAYILMGRVERARRRTERVSKTDPLTGLFNRRGLSDAANALLANATLTGSKCVVMFADLDNFKSINDTRGHAEGDRTLEQVAALLIESVRGSDLIARYGGDEFVLLLPGASAGEAKLISDRIQNAVGAWFRDKDLPCGISVGYAEMPPGKHNLDEILQSVDKLLYQSKAQRADG
jgi:diguanylate cyclase (GGDEF)-like protein